MKKQSPLKTRFPKSFALCCFLFVCVQHAQAQNPALKVFEDWHDTIGSQNTFYKSITRTILGTPNILVAGATLNSSGNYDMILEKLNGAGNVLWVQQYNGPGNGDDAAFDVQVDNGTGNIYLTGSYYEDAIDSNNAITIMYNSSGVQQWVASYNGTGSGNDGTASLVVNNTTGDAYCVGSEWEGNTNRYDMLILKYDNTGSQQWVTTWDYMNGDDFAYKFVINGSKGEVAGGSQTGPVTYDYAVLGIILSSGAAGASYSTGTPLGINKITDMVMDDSSNVYITGSVLNIGTLYDFRTIKLDSALNVKWSNDFDAGYNFNDIGTSIALDSMRNVIVSGCSETFANGKDYSLVKYNNNGALQWLRFFNGAANGDDSASAMVVDANDTNRIYVTGYSYNGSTNDYWTMRYDGAGNEVWGIGFNSLQNGDDRASAIALDTVGGVIVTGPVRLGDTVFNYSTVKYVEKMTMLPQDTILATSSSFVFTENRGQLLNTNGDSIPYISYYTINSWPNNYFTDTAVSYVFAKLDTSSYNSDTLIRVDMKFVGANSNLKIRAMDVRDEYENFFLGHIPEGRSCVQNYDKLVSFNVWNKVDMIFGSNSVGLKYYFVCKPTGGGGSSYQIDLKYEGADSVKIDGTGQLIIYTKLDNIIQPKAAAWQIDGSGNFSSLGWQPSYYLIGTNEVGFNGFGSYNTSLPLVIAVDKGNLVQQACSQGLVWSTLMGGGNGSDYFNDMSIAGSGEVYVCGYTTSITFPIQFAYFGSNAGGQDATVLDFHPGGNLAWATYYGGNAIPNGGTGAFDSANGIDVDNSTGNIYFTGITQSNDIPNVLWGNYNQPISGSPSNCTLGLCNDAFIAKLSSNGQNLLWSTYYGGVADDGGNSIAISPSGDICMVGYGGAGFPLTANATWTTGTGAIAKFDNNGNRVWTTMFDGYIYGNDFDISSNLIIAGYTGSSTGFPTTGAFAQTTYGGGLFDAFVSKFDASNNMIWNTYLGGGGPDIARDIIATGAGNPPTYFVTGYTSSPTSSPFPLVNSNQNTFGGGTGLGDAFVSKFNGSTGQLVWSTYDGGPNDERAMRIALDNQTNVYITGIVNGSGLPLPSPNLSNAYIASNSGFSDAFISCYQNNNNNTYNFLWATYFGGDGGDAGYALGYDNNQGLYLAGNTLPPTTFPLCQGTPTSFGARYYDGVVGSNQTFITLFDLSPVVVAGIPPITQSLNLNVFPNPASNGVWITGDISTNDDIVFEIFDVLGQEIFYEKYKPELNLNKQIDLSSYSNGIYMLYVQSGNQSFNRKIVLQK